MRTAGARPRPSLVCGKRFATMGDLEDWLLAQKLSPFVRVAFETAAWELVARTQGMSLRALFGLPHHGVASGLAVGLYPTLPDLRAALQRYDPTRYARLKIKIKRGADLELVRSVREWYGDIPLFVDANADYTRDDFAVFEHLDAFNLMMFEQPFKYADVETSALLQQRVATPLCFDEGIESAADVTTAAAQDACRIVNIKLQRLGGYLEALRVGEACLAVHLPLWMGTMPELGIGSAQALVLASHPANAFPTDVEPSTRWYRDDILTPPLELRDRMLHLPDGPGIGFDVDDDALARHAVARWSFPA